MSTPGRPVKLQVRIAQELFPPRHESHGTADPLVERVFAVEFPVGTAEVDQTDYGHPRRVPPALQPKTGQLLSAAGALAALLE